MNWISVKEKLPDNDRLVMACSKYKERLDSKEWIIELIPASFSDPHKYGKTLQNAYQERQWHHWLDFEDNELANVIYWAEWEELPLPSQELELQKNHTLKCAIHDSRWEGTPDYCNCNKDSDNE